MASHPFIHGQRQLDSIGCFVLCVLISWQINSQINENEGCGSNGPDEDCFKNDSKVQLHIP